MKTSSKILIIISLSFCKVANAQTNEYKRLLDTVFSSEGITFLSNKPLSRIELDNSEIPEYVEFLFDRYRYSLDTLMFSQIIANSKFVDTTRFNESEISNKILLFDRNEIIKLKQGIKTLGITDDKKRRVYKKMIYKFNLLDSDDRDIYYCSRPIFDNSKFFAIIQRDNGHSGLGGGGDIRLYHHFRNEWTYIGMVKLWRY